VVSATWCSSVPPSLSFGFPLDPPDLPKTSMPVIKRRIAKMFCPLSISLLACGDHTLRKSHVANSSPSLRRCAFFPQIPLAELSRLLSRDRVRHRSRSVKSENPSGLFLGSFSRRSWFPFLLRPPSTSLAQVTGTFQQSARNPALFRLTSP